MGIYNIPFHEPFLETLLDGIKERINPQILHKALVFLPSYKACRELEQKFISTHTNSSFLPPTILPLGNIEEALSFSIIEDLHTLPLPVTNVEAKFILARLIKKENKIQHTDALRVASELLQLVHKFEKEDIPLSELQNIFTGDIPFHIEKIFNYIKLISTKWIPSLREKNRCTQLERRNLFIKALIKKWETTPPDHPIIIAGSTGTFRSTQILLKSLSDLQNGYVVLQGANSISESNDPTRACFQRKNLISSLGVSNNNIEEWSNINRISNEEPVDILSYKNTPTTIDKHITYLEAKSIQEEAQVIAVKVRHLLEQSQGSIGIVTNNKCLRKSIQYSLKTWSINSESSDGIPFKNLPQTSLFLSIYKAALTKFDPIELLSLIKHRLFTMGYDSDYLSNITSKLEIKYLRGVRRYRDISSLIEIALFNKDLDIANFLQNIESNFKDLIDLLAGKFFIKDILTEVKLVAERITTPKDNSESELWTGEDGGKTYDTLNLIMQTLPIMKISSYEFEHIFNEVIIEHTIFPASFSKTRVQILSPVDSRLLNFDHLVIAGMNEKTWPEMPNIDPWVSQILYTNLGIPNHRYKIGQSANDFLSLIMQHEDILITRSLTENNTPQIASRFITKLGLCADINKSPDTEKLKSWAKMLNHPKQNLSYQKPEPTPTAELRPNRLSATQVEKLMRDPYSIYASKILSLKPLDKINKNPDQLEFGNLVHAIIDKFNGSSENLNEQEYYNTLENLGKRELNKLITNPIILKIWVPRLKQIYTWLSKYEKDSRSQKSIYSEIKYETFVKDNFSILAKIDRIEKDQYSNDITIIDFKTGSIPTQEDIKLGYSPQLPISAFLVESEDSNTKIINLTYIQLSSGKKLGSISKIQNAAELVNAAKDGVSKLIELYSDPKFPYRVCPRYSKGPTYNEFEHLERIDEIF